MPIEVRRFGAGFRRPEGPPGTHGLTGGVIHSDGRGVIAEFAFTRGGVLAPHDNPNTAWFCVIEGGGWVAVGDERRRVASGDAVLWPAGITHAAWTDHAEMRAIVVEFGGADDGASPAVVDGAVALVTNGATGGRRGPATPDAPGAPGRTTRGEGRLAERPVDPAHVDRTQGEPR
jgi:quercetin dioxygenase-like cupin family protein